MKQKYSAQELLTKANMRYEDLKEAGKLNGKTRESILEELREENNKQAEAHNDNKLVKILLGVIAGALIVIVILGVVLLTKKPAPPPPPPPIPAPQTIAPPVPVAQGNPTNVTAPAKPPATKPTAQASTHKIHTVQRPAAHPYHPPKRYYVSSDDDNRDADVSYRSDNSSDDDDTRPHRHHHDSWDDAAKAGDTAGRVLGHVGWGF